MDAITPRSERKLPFYMYQTLYKQYLLSFSPHTWEVGYHLTHGEIGSEKGIISPRSHSWQADQVSDSMSRSSTKVSPEQHHKRIMSSPQNWSLLSWSEYRRCSLFSEPFNMGLLSRGQTLPPSSKCFFSYSPQLELGVLQPRHHKSAKPLCSCWPLKNNWEGCFFPQWSIFLR